MSRKKSSDDHATKRRVPAPYRGIQVNFCKSPVCDNFDVPPQDGTRIPGRSATPDTRYSISGLAAGETGFKCKACGEILPAKSNRGIYCEMQRISAYLTPHEPGCPNVQCANHRRSVKSHGECYYPHGTSRHGNPRFRCKACRTTFSVGKATRKQRKPHENISVFRLLINKMSLRRMMEVTGLSAAALYGKIDFIHQQCRRFMGHREGRLVDGFEQKRLYLSTDRQIYICNWTRRTDRRNVKFEAVGTADNDSGYVFALNLNFNELLHANRIEDWAIRCGDYRRLKPFRRHAHLWLAKDYADSVEATLRNQGRHGIEQCSDLSDAIARQYALVDGRADVESAEMMDKFQALPHKGMQIHNEYTLYAHFLLLEQMFRHIGKVRFFMDLESGIRAAFMAAFGQRVRERSADAWYVRINKDMTVPERENAKKWADKAFEAYGKEHPELESHWAIRIAMTKEEIERMQSIGKWKDRWLRHPFPSMSEPEKRVCWLTDLDDYDRDHQAALYNKASLHAIDRAFMQARRRLSYLERPIQTASQRRTWHGYSAYDPYRMAQVLDIFRTAYNYCLPGGKKRTPAIRLGLAKGVVALEDIIYYP